MTTIRRILLTSALATAACGLASATSIAGTCSGVSGPTELGNPPANGAQTSGTITCSQFNVTGATLLDVVLTITGSNTGTITLTNGSTSSNTFSGSTTSDFFLNAALAGFSGLGSDDADSFFTTKFSTGNQTLAGNASQTFGPLNSATKTTGAQTDTTSSTFGAYTGSGNFAFTVDTLSSLSFTGGGGNAGGSNATSAAANATVSYDYVIPSGTPEPATMLLFGSGLLGLGLLRKRTKNS